MHIICIYILHSKTSLSEPKVADKSPSPSTFTVYICIKVIQTPILREYVYASSAIYLYTRVKMSVESGTELLCQMQFIFAGEIMDLLKGKFFKLLSKSLVHIVYYS